MSDRVRDMLLVAVRAARHGVPPSPSVAEAVVAGDRNIRIDQLRFDSLAWMEFCGTSLPITLQLWRYKARSAEGCIPSPAWTTIIP